MRIILASTSPQRRALFALLELPFHIVKPTWVETPDPQRSPRDVCRHHAVQKARSVASHYPSALVLSGDTVIEVDGQTLGKPNHEREAREMLTRLNGRSHEVHTGVALVHHLRHVEISFLDTARVWMRPLTDEEMTDYLVTGESMERAGSYRIQGEGAKLISHIEGDYTTVVGFPIRKVVDYLEDLGVEPPIDLHALYHDRPYPNWDRFSAR